MLWFGAWARRGLRARQCARRAARAPASSHTAPSPARLRSGARGRLPAAGARRRGRRASAARRRGKDGGSACKRQRECAQSVHSVVVERVGCGACGAHVARAACLLRLVLSVCRRGGGEAVVDASDAARRDRRLLALEDEGGRVPRLRKRLPPPLLTEERARELREWRGAYAGFCSPRC